jgi:hypothetical protein
MPVAHIPSQKELHAIARKLKSEHAKTPYGREHRRLLKLVPQLPGDYDPWGKVERWKDPHRPYPDCSNDCRFARWLEDRDGMHLSMDWCVCTNPKSHRVGLLTFEHQGCQKFEASR